MGQKEKSPKCQKARPDLDTDSRSATETRIQIKTSCTFQTERLVSVPLSEKRPAQIQTPPQILSSSGSYRHTLFLVRGATLCQLPFQELAAALRTTCLSNDKIPRLLHVEVRPQRDRQHYRRPGGQKKKVSLIRR